MRLARWTLAILSVAALIPAALAQAPRTAPADSASVKAGARLFKQYCEICHGKTGMGDGPTGKSLKPRPRNFRNPAEFKSKNDEEVFKVVSDGGAARGLSPLMVPWKSVLKEPQIWQVIAFIRSLAPKDGAKPASAGR